MTVLKNSIYAYGIITTLVFVTSSGNPVSPTLDQERNFADYVAMLKESQNIAKEMWPKSSSDWHTVDVFNEQRNESFNNVSTQGTAKHPSVLVSPRFKPVTKNYDLTELIKLTNRAQEVIRRTEEGLRNVSTHMPIDYKFPEPAFDHPVKFPDTPRYFPTQGTTRRPWVVITRIKTTQKPMITRNREDTDTNYWGELGRNLRNLETWTLNSAKTSFTAVYNWLHGN